MSIKGAWENDTPYQQGDLVVDTEMNSLWRANLNHTSAPTGSFVDERTLHPEFWSDASGALHARGQWAPATTYYTNDIVYNGYIWALVTRQHTSGTSFDQDVADGELVIIMDGTPTVEDSEAAATVAMSSASAAMTSETNASASATASSTSAANSSNAAANSAASANAADVSEANAAASAAQAQYLYDHMLPDAPNNGKYYGRQNETWQEIIAEAPMTGLTYSRRSGNWVPARCNDCL